MTLARVMFARLCRARRLLGEAHDRRIAIGAVARAVAMSPFRFIRTFHALFGETPHQFRIRARLDRARQLLAASDRSVTDVCMDVGFESLGSFSHLFAGRIGVAPSSYRRRIRRLTQVPGQLPRELTPGCLTLMGAALAAISEKQPAEFWHTLPLMRIKLTSIMVDNQDKALRFYTEVFGFVKKHEIPMGEFRWLTVVSPDGRDDLELSLEPNANPAGKVFQDAMFDQGIPIVRSRRHRQGIQEAEGGWRRLHAGADAHGPGVHRCLLRHLRQPGSAVPTLALTAIEVEIRRIPRQFDCFVKVFT